MSIFPTKILLATDGSEDAVLANKTAVELSNSTGSELHVITVGGGQPDPSYYLESMRVTYDQAQEAIIREAQDILDLQVQRIQESGGSVKQAHLKMGDRAREIIHLSEEMGVGLIVMGSRGLGGLRRAFMGSVSDSVVRHAPCPVMIVRQ